LFPLSTIYLKSKVFQNNQFLPLYNKREQNKQDNLVFHGYWFSYNFCHFAMVTGIVRLQPITSPARRLAIASFSSATFFYRYSLCNRYAGHLSYTAFTSFRQQSRAGRLSSSGFQKIFPSSLFILFH